MDKGKLRKRIGFCAKVLVFLFFIIILLFVFLMTSQDAQATNVEGHIILDTVWKLSDSPYIIRGNTYLDDDVNLTIEPGVEISFYKDYSFYINGDLFVNGSETNKTTFKSYNSYVYDNWEIRVNSLGNVIMNNCQFLDARNGLYIASDNNHIENAAFKNCDAGIYLYYAQENIIKNITIEDCENGVGIYQSYNNTLSNVHFRNISKEVIIFDTYYMQDPIYFNNTFENCTINDRSIHYHVRSENATIENKEVGMIVVAWGSYVTITNCNISNGGGIFLYYTQNSLISFCNISNNYNGIELDRSYTKGDDDNWSGNIIRNNTISHNSYGLRLSYSYENHIINNTIISNDFGIYFESQATNRIYHNNFINNNYSIGKSHSYLHRKNIWNTSSEGNYWGEFSKYDYGGDGICDSIYYIGYDNDDHYPLMNPYNGSIPPDTLNPYFSIDPYMFNDDIILPEESISIMFQTNEPGRYEIIVDSDRNDVFDSASDITIANDTEDSYNRIIWDGTDSLGNNVEDGSYWIQVMFWDPSGNPIDDPFILGPVSIVTDSDDDGVLDVTDAFPFDPRETLDMDGDGIGDNSDTDRDGDGYPNHDDHFPNNKNEWKDTDGDGLGDNEDPDDNGNNIDDIVEVPLSVMIMMMPIILIYLVNRSVSRRKKEREAQEEAEEEQADGEQ